MTRGGENKREYEKASTKIQVLGTISKEKKMKKTRQRDGEGVNMRIISYEPGQNRQRKGP